MALEKRRPIPPTTFHLASSEVEASQSQIVKIGLSKKALTALRSEDHRLAQRACRLCVILPLPRELLELDALGGQAVGAQAALLAFFVHLEVALEPFGRAVVFEGQDVGG